MKILYAIASLLQYTSSDPSTEDSQRRLLLLRLVCMTVCPEELEAFRRVYEEVAPSVRSFPGCLYLTFWEGVTPGEVATCSVWTSPSALEAYRSSAVFRRNWSRLKRFFIKRARVFSFYVPEEEVQSWISQEWNGDSLHSPL